MKKIWLGFAFIASLVMFTNCSGGFQSAGTSTYFISVTPDGTNSMPVTTGCGYWNEPCVSVTICQPGATSQCQKIDNVLIDTGSSGLRIFQSALDLSLPQVSYGGGSLAECIGYADGTAQWGSVKRAAVVLGGKVASNVEVQVVDRNFTGSSSCASYSNLDDASQSPGYNGILGVGLVTADCGATCASAANGMYQVCSGSSCAATTIPAVNQVTNPVAAFSSDNQGIVFDLSGVTVADTGSTSANGTIYFGLSSRVNNTPAGGAKIFAADSTGFTTINYGGTAYAKSFIDSGSNANYFADAGITQCAGGYAGFYCPAVEAVGKTLTITASDATVATVTFNVQNAITLNNANGGNNVAFNNLSGVLDSLDHSFDLGYPFFLGRKIYIGLDSANVTYPNGYWQFVP